MPVRSHFRPFGLDWFDQEPGNKGKGHNKGPKNPTPAAPVKPNADGKTSSFVPDPRHNSSMIELSHIKDLECLASITSGPEAQMQWYLEIADFRLSLAYIPKNGVLSDFSRGTMLKVVLGQVRLQQNPNTAPVLVNNCIYPFGLRDMTIRTDDNMITATKESVLMIVEPLFDTTIHDFPVVENKDIVNNGLKHPMIAGLPPMKFTEYSNMGFFNLTGFQFNLDGKKIAHQQYWLADKGVDCGTHDHSDLFGKDAFCEIHSCIVNGTGYGGMFRSDAPLGTPIDQIKRDDMTRLAVPSGHEHGPFWEWGPDGKPARRADTSIIYRPHSWIAGDGDPRTKEVTSMDYWIATEMEPEIMHNSLE